MDELLEPHFLTPLINLLNHWKDHNSLIESLIILGCLCSKETARRMTRENTLPNSLLLEWQTNYSTHDALCCIRPIDTPAGCDILCLAGFVSSVLKQETS